MTIETMAFVLGGLLLAAGLFGGGFKIGDITVPRIGGPVRLVSCLAGVAFIVLALALNQKRIDQRASQNAPPIGSLGQKAGSVAGPPSAVDTRPLLTLSQEITDASGKAINRRQAPFKIRVNGTVVDVSRVYVYLVVDDANAEWIEPTSGLGPHVGGDFSGFCYLGVENDRTPTSLKLYKVFAVATTRAYNEYEKLDRTTILAQSSPPLEVFRVR